MGNRQQPMGSFEFTVEKTEATLECFKQNAQAIISGPEGSLVVAGNDGVKIMDNAVGDVKHTLEDHSYSVMSVCLIGNTLFTGAEAKGRERAYLRAWDFQRATALHENMLGHTSGVWSLCEVEGMLISGSEDGTLRIWDAKTFECTKVIEAHEGRVRCLFYDQAESKLYSGGHDSKLRVWDTKTWQQLDRSFEEQGGWLTSISCSLDGHLLAVSSADKTVFVYEKSTGQKKQCLLHDSWVSSLNFEQDFLFVGVGDASVVAWKAAEAGLQCKLNGHQEFHAVSDILIKDGKLYSAGWDGVVSKWDLAMIKEELENRVEEEVIEEVDVSVKAQPVVVQSGSIFDETDCELLD